MPTLFVVFVFVTDTQSAQVMNMRSNQPVEIKIGSEDCKASTNTYCNKYLPQDTQI